MDKELKELEKKQSEEGDSEAVPPPDIVAYNELRSCSEIFRMYEKGQIDISPEFQRGEVWPPATKARFIDSLTKELPIPSMCISLDFKSQRRIVIDGLQRISTIIAFLNEGDDFELSKLDDIDSKISGKTNRHIREKEIDLYERVENLMIPITVLRCDYSKKSHRAYLFNIFHRLNTGGIKLNNQEIRNCIYSGTLNNLLKDLVKDKKYVAIYKTNRRFAHEEMALRFITFSKKFEEYRGRQGSFLNEYMDSNKDIKQREIDLIKEEFMKVHDIINNISSNNLYKKRFKNLSKAIHEALYVGIQRNLAVCLTKSDSNLLSDFSNLLEDDLFSVDSLKEGLSSRAKVQNRLKKAIEIFN